MILSEELGKEFVGNMYRAIAVFSADIYAAEAIYGYSPTCAQINDFWVKTDEKFFILTER